jgi:hypothetical protein
MRYDQDQRTITIELNYGSAALDDVAFAKSFEHCAFPQDHFRHADHVRLAWIYLRQHAYEIAEERMRRSIYQFACHVGVRHKYHETMTIAWLRLVNAAFQVSSRMTSFRDFVSAHAWLLSKDAILEFYSRDRLLSETARTSWVEPDTKPLPAIC